MEAAEEIPGVPFSALQLLPSLCEHPFRHSAARLDPQRSKRFNGALFFPASLPFSPFLSVSLHSLHPPLALQETQFFFFLFEIFCPVPSGHLHHKDPH